MTPNRLQDTAAGMRELYAQAEEIMLGRVARRAARGLDDDPAAWASRKLAEVRQVRRDIERELQKLERASAAARGELLETAYDAGAEELRRELERDGLHLGGVPESRTDAVGRLRQELDARFDAMHSAILRDVDDQYRAVIGKAVSLQSTGVITTREAVRTALNDFADRGIAGFTDRAGRRWQMDSYAEMAVRTGMMNAAVQGYTDDAVANGEHLVIVSDHQDTCPLCAEWERRILALDDAGARMPESEGLLADAETAGLFHPNCLHSVTVYVPGLTDRSSGKSRQGYTPSMDAQGYRDRQRQRYMERQVRRYKRRQAVATTPEDERLAKAYVDKWQRRLREHTGSTGLPRQYYREGGRVKLSDAAKRMKPVRLDQVGMQTAASGAAGARAAGRSTGGQTGVQQNEYDRFGSLEDFDREIERLREQRRSLFEQDSYDKNETDALLEKIIRLQDLRENWGNANKLAAGDKEIRRDLLSDDPVRVIQGIEKAIGGDRFGLPGSKWSGVAEVKPEAEMPDDAIGAAVDPTGDIWIQKGYLHDYTVGIHEDLHLRSIHRYDDRADRQWVRNNIRGYEEGVVELRNQTICERLGIAPSGSYRRYTDALRLLHRVFEPRKTEYDFAKELFDRTPISRYTYCEQKAQELKSSHPRKWRLVGPDVERALAALRKPK